jgi:hypothetical protein
MLNIAQISCLPVQRYGFFVVLRNFAKKLFSKPKKLAALVVGNVFKNGVYFVA